MSDYTHNQDHQGDQRPGSNLTGTGASVQDGRAAFQSQLDHLANTQHQPLDMGAMAHSLPLSPQMPQYVGGGVGAGRHAPPYAMNHMHFDGGAMARAQENQQGQYLYPPYTGFAQASQTMRQIHAPPQYNSANFYGMQTSSGILHPHAQAMDPRLAQVAVGPFATSSHPSQFVQRNPESAPVPSYPRGPPRKPKQSGHALWVGNLPPAARIEDLKDHFSRDATNDIESLFLISKSNCAFVNYRSEEACASAMTKFHESRFQGTRLVCRLRRNTGGSQSASAVSTAQHTVSEAHASKSRDDGRTRDQGDPVIVGAGEAPLHTSPAQVPGADTARAAERYFIVKSLTVQDLLSSTRSGIWATQNHNEKLFNEAFENADNVYLIFSANKSGEFFGYARMQSKIAGQPVNLNAPGATSQSSGTPQAIETPATDTAPKGRIIDDSARGTIFWEATPEKNRDDVQREPSQNDEGRETTSGSNWGRQFSVEWLSTSRLPFYRTRGLRNPWNSQREVKIARDGTELETSIGMRLVAMFHGPGLAS